MKNNGYQPKYGITLIDQICDNPKNYKNCIQGAMNDARTHYEFGNTSKEWYESVIRILTEAKEELNKK